MSWFKADNGPPLNSSALIISAAIPKLLQTLERHGCIVTIGAMGCQTNIATSIVDRGGDYVLAVKEDQGRLYQDLDDLFRVARGADFRDTQHDVCRTVNKGHG